MSNTLLFTPSRPSRTALGDISNHKIQASLLKSVRRLTVEPEEEIHGMAHVQIDSEVEGLSSISEIIAISAIPLSPIGSVTNTPDYLTDSDLEMHSVSALALDEDFSYLQREVDEYIISPVLINLNDI